MSTGLDGAGVRVLLAGTGRHAPGSRLPPVPAVAETIEELRATFVTAGGVRPEVIRTLIDPPGPEALLDAVIEAAEEARDVLVIYYVGHGVLTASGELHLATHATTDVSKKAAYQALPFAEIRNSLIASRATRVVVVLDCCYSGRADNPVPSGALLASADRDEQALAPPGERFTAFSGSLIAALRDGIPTAPLDLRLQHVYDHLYRTMSERGRPLPILRIGNRAADLVIARNAAYQERGEPEEPPADGSCPYRGLASYTAHDEAVFAGRDQVVTTVLRRLREAIGTGGIVLVSGPSGSGKSSALAAGVIPAIRGGELDALWPGRIEPALITPGENPLGALAAAGTAAGRLVIVDQFEELFTAPVPEADRRAFVEALAAGPAPAVVGVRSDFNGHCAQHPELAAAMQDRHVVVGPMSTRELRAAITGPAARTGFELETGLVEILLRDAGADPGTAGAADYNPGVLPLLSHALLRTWQRRRGRTLTVTGYREIGGVAGAVAASAEEVFDGLPAPHQVAARATLLGLVRIGVDGPDTRRRIPRSAVADETTLAAFAAARLVTLDRDTAELTHEALIRSWPRLSGWIDEDRAGQLVAQEVTEAAAGWLRSGREPAQLYRGGRLAAARSRLGERPADGLSAEFLDVSYRQERRQSRFRRAVVAAVAALAVLASATAWAAISRGNRLDRQLTTATAENLANLSNAQVLDRPGFGSRLAVAAWRAEPADPAARTALSRRFVAMRSVQRVFPALTGERITGLTVSTDGRTALLNHDSGGTIVTGLLGDRASTWDVPGLHSAQAALSPDGRWLAVLDTHQHLGRWDLHNRTGPVPLTGSPVIEGAAAVTFAADSSRILLGYRSRLFAWTTSARAPIRLPAALSGTRPIDQAWFTDAPDRVLIEYASTEESLETRSLTDGRLVARFPSGSVAAAGGARVVTTCSGSTSVIRSAATGRPVRTWTGDETCPRVSGDSGHLLNFPPSAGGQAHARITSIGDGRSFDVMFPAVRVDALTVGTRESAASVVDPPGGAPTVLVVDGSSVVRLGSLGPDFVPPETEAAVGAAGRMLIRTGDGIDAIDAATGTRVTHVSIDPYLAGSDIGRVDFTIPLTLAQFGDEWHAVAFDPASLTPRATVVVPDSQRSNTLYASLDGTRLTAATSGRVGAWDVSSGRVLAGPVSLATLDGRHHELEGLATVPSHPATVAVSAMDQPVELWDLDAARPRKTLPTWGDLIFDRDGGRLAVLRPDHTVEIWDTGRGVREGTPFTVPDAYGPIGFTDDGYLEIQTANGNSLQLWDTSRHVLSGELPLATGELVNSQSDAGSLSFTGSGSLPGKLPVDARVWAQRLCAVFPGGFSKDEKDLLPPGADTGDPCAGQ